MRRFIISAVLCVAAAPLLAAPKVIRLDVKTGLWENTMSNLVSGSLGIPPEMAAQMTPEQRARVEAAMKKRSAEGEKSHTITSRHCVTEKDLETDPFTQKRPGQDTKCDEHVVRSTGKDLEVRENCSGEGTSKSEVHLLFHAIDSEHVSGTSDVTATMGGHTMHSQAKMTMKWLGACPAGKNP